MIVVGCVSGFFSSFFSTNAISCNIVSEIWRSCCLLAVRLNGSDVIRVQEEPSDRIRLELQLSFWSASPSADCPCHPPGLVGPFYPPDDYSVSKLTLCRTFLSSHYLCAVGKKEVDDWADYQKLFFRGQFCLTFLFSIWPSFWSRSRGQNVSGLAQIRREYLIFSSCFWNWSPSWLYGICEQWPSWN